MTKILRFIRSNFVLCIAFGLALVTSFIIPPDNEYIGYFDRSLRNGASLLNGKFPFFQFFIGCFQLTAQ